MLKQPIFAIDADEAGEMAARIAELSKFYNFTIDPKRAAWIGLGVTCATIYGKRVLILKQMKEEARRQRMNPAPGNQEAAQMMEETPGLTPSGGAVDFSALHNAENQSMN